MKTQTFNIEIKITENTHPEHEFIITGIEQGEGDFRSKILYARVERIGGGLVCSATLEFILRMYYVSRDSIENYQDSLNRFLDFHESLIRKR